MVGCIEMSPEALAAMEHRMHKRASLRRLKGWPTSSLKYFSNKHQQPHVARSATTRQSQTSFDTKCLLFVVIVAADFLQSSPATVEQASPTLPYLIRLIICQHSHAKQKYEKNTSSLLSRFSDCLQSAPTTPTSVHKAGAAK